MNETNPKQRAVIFARMVKIMTARFETAQMPNVFQHLEELKNYNGLVELRAATDSATVTRMKETMAAVPK